jgi:Tfp pilus assembly protein PilN
MQNVLGLVLTILGLITTVGGPVVAALAANPQVQAHQKLVTVLAWAGVVVMVCGVALTALHNWQQTNQDTALKLAGKRPC